MNTPILDKEGQFGFACLIKDVGKAK